MWCKVVAKYQHRLVQLLPAATICSSRRIHKLLQSATKFLILRCTTVHNIHVWHFIVLLEDLYRLLWEIQVKLCSQTSYAYHECCTGPYKSIQGLMHTHYTGDCSARETMDFWLMQYFPATLSLSNGCLPIRAASNHASGSLTTCCVADVAFGIPLTQHARPDVQCPPHKGVLCLITARPSISAGCSSSSGPAACACFGVATTSR